MLTEKPWKLEHLLLFLTAIFIALFAILSLRIGLEFLIGKEKFAAGTTLGLLFNSLLMPTAILFGALALLRQQRLTWTAAFGLAHRPILRAIGLGILGGLVFLPVGNILQQLSIKILDKIHVATPVQAAVEEFNKTSSTTSLGLLAFYAIVLAPFAEEICFRGIIYPTIKQLNLPRVALWFTAFLFAAVHGNLPTFFPLMVLSLLLTWLYEYTDNLLAAMAAHATFNSVNVYLLLFTELGKTGGAH